MTLILISKDFILKKSVQNMHGFITGVTGEKNVKPVLGLLLTGQVLY